MTGHPHSSRRRLAPVLLAAVLIGAGLGSGPGSIGFAPGALGTARPLHAQPPEGETGAPTLVSLFPHRAPLRAPAGRLARLLLPPEVLAACRGDLSDLRILDARGREVPYLLDTGRAPDEAVEVLERLRAELLGADQGTVERDQAPPIFRETYDLAPPPAAPAGQGWELVVVTGRERFVRRVVVASSGDGVLLAEGSVYRLARPGPEGSAAPRRERLRLALPAAVSRAEGGASGRVPPLRVTLSGEGGPFLDPAFRYERSRRLPGAERTRAVLKPLELGGGDGIGATGRTVIELERPRGLVPDLLVLRTTTPAFSRSLEVWDDGPGAVDRALGTGTVLRIPGPGADDGSGGPPAVEDLEIALRPAQGDRLRVVIHDGDSPPLAGLAFEAALRRPALLFSLPADSVDSNGAPEAGAAAVEASARLVFGGGRAYAPRYDLAALLSALPAAGRAVDGEAAVVGERLVDPRYLAEARLGAIEDNPRFDPSPALAFAHRPGAPLDPRLFRFRRTLRVRASPDGLARLVLAPEDLARARRDLADLRIVDAEDRQWAYLVEDDVPEELLPLAVERRDGERPATSRYELVLPARPATLDQLVLEIDAPFFDRPYVLVASGGEAEGREDGERELARGRLHRRPGDPRPVTVAFAPTRAERLVLEVEDGSDAPLPVASARGRFPLPELYFPAPEGDYALLLGHPEAEAPRYELGRARDLVLAVAAEPAEAGELAENPAHRTGLRFLAGRGLQQILLWTALVAAVVVLALFTLRLARGE